MEIPHFYIFNFKKKGFNKDMQILIVAIGGALGSVSRYLVSLGYYRFFETAQPWNTAIVNILGSFVAGIIFAQLQRPVPPSHFSVLFLVVGFLGGFTTFSAFSLETLNYFHKGQMTLGLLNVTINLLGSLIAVFIGSMLSFRAI
jgi:CrcB protein